MKVDFQRTGRCHIGSTIKHREKHSRVQSRYPKIGENRALACAHGLTSLGPSLRHAEDKIPWDWAAIGIFYGVMLLLAVYHKRTPLIKNDGKTWIYYGYFPWQNKYFLTSSIEKITLSPVLNAWRRAYSLTILTSDGKYHIWLSNSRPLAVRQLRQMLAIHLKDKYSEIYA